MPKPNGEAGFRPSPPPWIVSGGEHVPGGSRGPGCGAQRWGREGVQARGGTAGPTGLLHPPLVLGTRSRSVFLIRALLPLPGELAGLRWPVGWSAWAAEPGISLQTLPVSLSGGSLPFPRPTSARPGILLSPALARAKVLGKEIDGGLLSPPHKAAVPGPSMTHCPRRGEEVAGGVPVSSPRRVQASAGGLSVASTLLCRVWEPYFFEGSAFSKDVGTAPGTGGTIWKNSPEPNPQGRPRLEGDMRSK